MHFRFPALVGTTVAALLIASCTPAEEQATPTPEQAPEPTEEPTTWSYVALGDSYAAMGSTASETTGPGPCVRSVDNYPAGVLALDNVEGVDESCSGARTEHVLGEWHIGGEVIPPQIDALGPDTSLVTLSIGGNDISFSSLVDCFIGSFSAGEPTRCRGQMQAMVDEELAALPAELDAVHAAIRERSPEARVLVTGYVPLVAEGEQCADVPLLSEDDQAWIVDLTAQLNETVAAAAKRHDAEFVLPTTAAEHTACAEPAERWVDFFGANTGAYPMHPTPAGQRAMAAKIAERL
ncbi:SGNH/GDSL hydrolase family protein [Corynebacterium yudongzhengii]|uniref:SGNH/GDSL hydrolase family protein n=1 Tax=Corynebacterium yudongzhengii TaxID=2080740 RepID=A0A2U1T545_9CORY|nr:SGNH/GDSL hydrolase family protein [Corynebacterium yudongzhengii]AWB80947.1 SGNH/GDSL hydrolase family protein [Corynebacterium yudongzhengii]PWC01127.1 SGNH/GDSL hydrolase family protein [Corynebacterium yudongzhengii]